MPDPRSQHPQFSDQGHSVGRGARAMPSDHRRSKQRMYKAWHDFRAKNHPGLEPKSSGYEAAYNEWLEEYEKKQAGTTIVP